MDDLNKLLDKLYQEKCAEKEHIIEEAQQKRKEILNNLRQEIETYFENWLKEEKQKVLAKKQEEIFFQKREATREILERQDMIINKALKTVEKFLQENQQYLPHKEMITKKGKEKIRVDVGEFLVFLKEKHWTKIKSFLDEDNRL